MTVLDMATDRSVCTRKIGETSRYTCSTPTLDGDHLYALDPDGDLICLQVTTGEAVLSLSQTGRATVSPQTSKQWHVRSS